MDEMGPCMCDKEPKYAAYGYSYKIFMDYQKAFKVNIGDATHNQELLVIEVELIDHGQLTKECNGQ